MLTSRCCQLGHIVEDFPVSVRSSVSLPKIDSKLPLQPRQQKPGTEMNFRRSAALALVAAIVAPKRARARCTNIDECREIGDRRSDELEAAKGALVDLGQGLRYREARVGTGAEVREDSIVEVRATVGDYIYSYGRGRPDMPKSDFGELPKAQQLEVKSSGLKATDKLNRWLTVQLARFQQICHTASKNGADSARCSISEVDLQGFSLQEVCDKLKHKLSSLGLAELSVLCSMGVVTLHASWAGVKPTPEDQARDMPRIWCYPRTFSSLRSQV
ncbi:unnamed protein product [Symbiodinium natans]|uniref:Uncharacterized protein n=1 Tax=Symbiodinium natans TaxID=878477 RepID=A0A812IP86_9DINO|nr:unnamed protein product [Symbiodinium natans]